MCQPKKIVWWAGRCAAPGLSRKRRGKGPRLDSPPARPGDHILDHAVLASATAAPAGNAKKPFGPETERFQQILSQCQQFLLYPGGPSMPVDSTFAYIHTCKRFFDHCVFWLPIQQDNETTNIESNKSKKKVAMAHAKRPVAHTKAKYKAVAKACAPRNTRRDIAKWRGGPPDAKSCKSGTTSRYGFKGKPKHGTTMDSTSHSTHHKIYFVFCPVQQPACKSQLGNASRGPFFSTPLGLPFDASCRQHIHGGSARAVVPLEPFSLDTSRWPAMLPGDEANEAPMLVVLHTWERHIGGSFHLNV